MSVMYITENDKNGKARYYRVTDGKKKVISRFEYEANAEINANKTEIIGEEVQTNDCQITLADDFECNVKESSIKETYEKSGIDILDVARGVLAETKIAAQSERPECRVFGFAHQEKSTLPRVPKDTG